MSDDPPNPNKATSAKHPSGGEISANGDGDDSDPELTNGRKPPDPSRKHGRSMSTDTDWESSAGLKQPRKALVNNSQPDPLDPLKDQGKQYHEVPGISPVYSRSLQNNHLRNLFLPRTGFPLGGPRTSDHSRPMSAQEATKFHDFREIEKEAMYYGYNPSRNSSSFTSPAGFTGIAGASPGLPNQHQPSPTPRSGTFLPTGPSHLSGLGINRQGQPSMPQGRERQQSGSPGLGMHGQSSSGSNYIPPPSVDSRFSGQSSYAQAASNRGYIPHGAVPNRLAPDTLGTPQQGSNYGGSMSFGDVNQGRRQWTEATTKGSTMKGSGHTKRNGTLENSQNNLVNGGSGKLTTKPLGKRSGQTDQRGDGNAHTHIDQINHSGVNIIVYPPPEVADQVAGGMNYKLIPGQGDHRAKYGFPIEWPTRFLDQQAQLDRVLYPVFDRRLFWFPVEADVTPSGQLDKSKIPELPWDWNFLMWSGDYPVVRDLFHQILKLVEVGSVYLPPDELQNLGLQDQTPGGVNHPEAFIETQTIMEKFSDVSYWYRTLYLNSIRPTPTEGQHVPSQGGDGTSPLSVAEQPNEATTKSISRKRGSTSSAPAKGKRTAKSKQTPTTNVRTDPPPNGPPSDREKNDCPDGLRTQGDFWRLIAKNIGIDFDYTTPVIEKPQKEKPKSDKIPLGALVAASVKQYREENPDANDNSAAIDFPILVQDGRAYKQLKSVATSEKVDLRLAGTIEWTLYELLAYTPWHVKSPDFYKRINHVFSRPTPKLPHRGNSDACDYINYFRDLKTLEEHFQYNTLSSQHCNSRQKSDETRVVSQLDPKTDLTVMKWHFADEWRHVKETSKSKRPGLAEITDYPLLGLKWGVCVAPQIEDKGPITLVMEYCEQKAKHDTKYLMYMLSDVPRLMEEAGISPEIVWPAGGKHPDTDFHERHKVAMKAHNGPLKILAGDKFRRQKQEAQVKRDTKAAETAARRATQTAATIAARCGSPLAQPPMSAIEVEDDDDDNDNATLASDQDNEALDMFSPGTIPGGDDDDDPELHDSGFAENLRASPGSLGFFDDEDATAGAEQFTT